MTVSANILIIDRNRLFREGLRRILSGKRFAVRDDTISFAEALERMRTGLPGIDLVLGDPGADMAEHQAIATLRSEYPDLKIAVLTDTPMAIAGELALGEILSGLLSKDLSAAALKHSLELILMGETVAPLSVIGAPPSASAPRKLPIPDALDGAAPAQVSAEPPDISDDPPADDAELDSVGLSDREDEILKCLVGGMSNKLIARQLDLAEATVKVHVRAVLRKLKAQNRTQAAIWAMKNTSTHRAVPAIRHQRSVAAMATFDRLSSVLNGTPI